MPLWINGLNQFKLLHPRSPFNLFFPSNCNFNIIKYFIINKFLKFVGSGKFTSFSSFMLLHPAVKVIGHSGIKSRIVKIGHDVDVIFSIPHILII